MRCGEPIWHTRSTWPMSMPSSSDAVATSAFSSPRFSRCSASRRRSFARLPWCAATASSPRRSDRCRARRSTILRVLTNTSVVRCPAIERGQAIVVLLPHFVRHHRLERRSRQLEREVGGAAMALVDDDAVGAPVGADVRRPDQEARDVVDRPLRRREADPLHRMRADVREPLERERQVRAAPRADHGVDLVDDHRPHVPQAIAAALGGQHQVERLRSRHQDVRRLADHRRALGRGRVAGADRRGDPRAVEAQLGRQPLDGGARLGEVLVDVAAQRLQRRDIDDAHLVRQRTGQAFLQQVVEGDEERRQRLAGSGRRGDQGVPAVADRGPAARLPRRGRADLVREPALDDGMKRRQRRARPRPRFVRGHHGLCGGPHTARPGSSLDQMPEYQDHPFRMLPLAPPSSNLSVTTIRWTNFKLL